MANLNIKSDKDVIRKGCTKPSNELPSQISCARGFPGALGSSRSLQWKHMPGDVEGSWVEVI